MKKVVVASLLAVASMASVAGPLMAQTQVNLGSNAQATSGGVQMSPAEYKAYNDAISQTTPQTKAPALEQYLTAYPQSSVKASVLEQLMLAYAGFDPTKTLDAADRLLQVDPNNLRALTFEVYFRKQQADQTTDPTAKQTALDLAASFAQKGLAVTTKPADMSDADFAKVKDAATPVFDGAIAAAALNKKDTATAITDYKAELTSVPVAQTQTPGPLLQDTFILGQAYYQSTPPDYVNCTWYATRAAVFAPEPYKSQMLPLAKFCYKKYHGGDDGYDAVTAAVQTNLVPPADFKIKPAPSNGKLKVMSRKITSARNISSKVVRKSTKGKSTKNRKASPKQKKTVTKKSASKPVRASSMPTLPSSCTTIRTCRCSSTMAILTPCRMPARRASMD